MGTFAPASGYRNLDEVIDGHSRGSVVEVLLTWRERVLSASHFGHRQKIYLGNDESCELKLSALDFKRHFFINIDNGAQIQIPEQMEGFLYRGQQKITLSSLKESQQMSYKKGVYYFNLSQGEMLKCFLRGDTIQAYIRYVEQTPRAMSVSHFDFTASEIVSIVMAFILSSLIATYMTFHSPKRLNDMDTLVEDQYRIAKVHFEAPKIKPSPPPPSPPKISPIKKVQKKVPVKKKLIKKIKKKKKNKKKIRIKKIVDRKTREKIMKQSLGKRGSRVKIVSKKKGTPKKIAPNKVKKKAKGLVSNRSGGAVKTSKKAGANAQSKRKDVSKSGLLGVLSTGGAAKTLSKAYSGAGTTFGLADKATGFGGQASNRSGKGLGTDLKNVGRGGKGISTVGISGVGSKGRGGGATSYGGSGGLGNKGQTAIVNVDGLSEEFISSIDKEAIKRIIRRNRRAIKSCYDLELIKNPSLSGKIVLQWRITQGGKMIKPKVKSNDMATRTLGPCIIKRLRVLKFPDPGPDEIAEVAFPFVFEAR